jgi:hypothetical protein
MKIAEILNQWPDTAATLKQFGMGDLVAPAVRESAAKMVSLKMGVTKAGANLGEVMAAIEGGRVVTTDESDAPTHPDHHLPIGQQIIRGELAGPETQVGNLMEVYPETKVVFSTHYGEACFTCPGQKTETVEQTAMMHGMAASDIVNEINHIIKKLL